jgi:hypothetical protein
MLRSVKRLPVAFVRCGHLARVHVTAQNIDSQLRNDVKLLGNILGNSIQRHEPAVFAVVEDLRKLGREVKFLCTLLWLF